MFRITVPVLVLHEVPTLNKANFDRLNSVKEAIYLLTKKDDGIVQEKSKQLQVEKRFRCLLD